MPPESNVQGEKSGIKNLKNNEKIDIRLPETSLAAMFVFLKPRWQRCRDSKIIVTMAFWEVNSRHAGELSVFFVHEKVTSAIGYRG